jgi:formiminotetrahydrofolate cyclodeaminase
MPREQTLGAFLDELASAAPTPGGGAAAALTLAQSAALLSMVCALTLGKQKFADRETAIRLIHAHTEAIRSASERLIDADARAFGGFGLAAALPKDTPEAAALRSQALQAASADSAAVPGAVFSLAAALLAPGGPAAHLAVLGNPNVLSDVHVARHLAWAALESAEENVRVNLPGLKNPGLAAEWEARLDRKALPERSRMPSPEGVLRSDGPADVARILALVPSRLWGD